MSRVGMAALASWHADNKPSRWQIARMVEFSLECAACGPSRLNKYKLLFN